MSFLRTVITAWCVSFVGCPRTLCAFESSGHGAGTVEARIQTPSNAANFSLPVSQAPGFFYDPSAGEYLLNLSAGAGYFVSDAFALGLDVGHLRTSFDGGA